MANTPPPPAPAPGSDPVEADGGANAVQGGLDRDVNSILANLNQEQLASIVAAARASEGNSDAASAGLDASSILAALPPGLGQAATALTSFASSLRRENENAPEREQGAGGEQREDGDGGMMEGEAGHQEAGEETQPTQQTQQHDDDQHLHQDDSAEDKKPIEGGEEHVEAGDYTHAGDDSEQLGDQTTGTLLDESTEEYRNEQTQAAIAAMESLAAQSGLQIKGAGRAKRDTGPEAERLRKDQHKEVERKRREQISNGITELANIVPGCDSKGINKTAIINSAVRYIIELKDNEASNIEKWTLEKLLMDQAMGDLSAQLDSARKELSRLRAQLGLPDEPDEPAEPQQYADDGDQQEGEEGQEQLEEAHEHQEEHADHAVGDQEEAPVTGEEAIDTAMDEQSGGGDKAASNTLNQVAEAAIAAAAEAGEGKGTTAVEAVDGTEDDAKAQNGRTRDANDADLTAGKDESGRAKRSRHA